MSTKYSWRPPRYLLYMINENGVYLGVQVVWIRSIIFQNLLALGLFLDYIIWFLLPAITVRIKATADLVNILNQVLCIWVKLHNIKGIRIFVCIICLIIIYIFGYVLETSHDSYLMKSFLSIYYYYLVLLSIEYLLSHGLSSYNNLIKSLFRLWANCSARMIPFPSLNSLQHIW